MEPLQIITTVGTSIITNYIDAKAAINSKKRDVWVDITRMIDKEFEELPAANYTLEKTNDPFSGGSSKVAKKLSDIKEALSFFIFNGFKKADKTSVTKWETDDNSKLNTNASAEISSIIKIQDKNTDKKLRVYLLASDTVLSMLSAKLIQEWFQEARLTEPEKYKNIEIIFNDNVTSGKADFIPNLRTDLQEDKIFTGFNNLVDKVVKLSKDGETTINITGGYKGFIPILTIIAQIEGLKLNYLYEDSDKLIEIIKFPVSFDIFVAETYHYYLEEKKNLKYLGETEIKKLIDLSLITDNNQVTAIGQFFLEYLKNVDFSRDTLGHYYEHKLFYQIFKNQVEQLKNYTVEELGFSFDPSKGKEGEIDLILNSTNGKCFIEVKSFKKAGQNENKKQIEKYINYAKEKSISLNEIVLFVYKFDFQSFNQKKKHFIEMKNICESEDIEFSVLYSDIQMSQQDMMNYKYLFENELEIKKLM